MIKMTNTRIVAKKIGMSNATVIKHCRDANIINNLLNIHDLDDLIHYYMIKMGNAQFNKYERLINIIEKLKIELNYEK